MRLTRNEITYEAAERFCDVALRADDSLFTPGTSIWAEPVLRDLHERFVERPDESSDTFLEKFKRQLDGAPDSTIQLAGELLYVHFLAPDVTSGERKREVINEVLAWAKAPVTIPGPLQPALDHGLGGGGIAFNTLRPNQLTYLLELALHWKALPSEQRDAALDDPWLFREVAWDVPVDGGHGQREALLHLVHPDTFEDNLSRAALQKIASRFSHLVDDPTDEVHRQVFQIRQRLAEEVGRQFSFYDPEIRPRWAPDTSKWGMYVYWAGRFFDDPDFDADERDYKLELAPALRAVREAVMAGEEAWPAKLKAAFQQKGNNLTSWQSHVYLVEWAEQSTEEARRALEKLWAPQGTATERIRTFLAELPTDVVSGPSGRLTLAVYLHMANDPADYPPYRYSAFQESFKLTDFPAPPADADEAATYDHALAFLDKFSEEAESRGLSLRDRLDAQGIVWCFYNRQEPPRHWSDRDWKAFSDYYAEALGTRKPEDEEEPPAERDRSLSTLAEELLLDEAHLAQIEALLQQKGQIIFYGPPGTGKTYVARKLARFLAESPEHVTIVQFHPSYAYEDFIEGYRPKLIENRQPGFDLEDGPVKELAQQAVAEPDKTFFLIIDEINRGNVAKVFGELYYLLEYRQDQIRLQYSRQHFSLPRNLRIIGTMNTADRSIALVDAALRRRFHFYPFFPDRPPIEGLLRRWLERNGPDFLWVADVLDRANQLLDNRHLAIGPSHFMKKELLSEEWIERVWTHSVLPYLEEHFFGEEERIEEFGLERLREDEPTS